jgi:glucose/arabinose dehydrogenase
MLYIALGDGGSGNDPAIHAQNTSSLLGKILRIDVRGSQAAGFVVPAGNAGLPRPEIWSIGWRNPWKFSFDHPSRGGTGAMLIGDVGQGSWEEVDYEPAGRSGRNYGWRNREGAHAHFSAPPPAYLPLIDPIHEYSHLEGQSITGGYVYRGRNLPELTGRYFFADFVRRRIWSIRLTVNGATGEATGTDRIDHSAELATSRAFGNVSGFGIDSAGELYVLDYTGSVLRMAGVPRVPTSLRIIREEP